MCIKPTRQKQTIILDYVSEFPKFTLIEHLKNAELDKVLLTFRLKKRENFWINKLKTLKPHGCYTEINFPNPLNFCIFSTKYFLEDLMHKGLL